MPLISHVLGLGGVLVAAAHAAVRGRKVFPIGLDHPRSNLAVVRYTPEIEDVPPAIDTDLTDGCATCEHRFSTYSRECRSCPFVMAARSLMAPEATPPDTISRTHNVLKPALPAADSAERFVTWMQANGFIGQHNSKQLRDRYRDFCVSDQRRPCADNTLRESLRDHPDVSREVVRVSKGKKRESRTFWIIKESAPAETYASIEETFDSDLLKRAA